MKLVVASAFLSIVTATAIAQQQQPAPPPPPPAAPGSPTGQATTPANQGVTTNPSGNAPGNQPATGVPGNASGRSAFDQPGANQAQANATVGNAPLFLNVSATTITDANGQPLGTLQQLVLTPSGSVNFGLVNIGGRVVPVPWQLIVAGTAGRPGLAVNTDRQLLQRAPAFATAQVPMLTQEDIQQQILAHYALQAAQPPATVVTTGTARGGTGGAGVTITGGAFSPYPFNTNNTAVGTSTNTNTVSATASNQAVNTTSGLLSPTGRTNAAYDGYNPSPATPPPNARPNNPPQNNPPPNNPAPNTGGPPAGQR